MAKITNNFPIFFMNELRDVYAKRALSQIPRLLSLQDRNRFSPTYGSFKRTYWLDKTADFIDALPQYGVSSLVMAYTHEMPGNIFQNQEKVLEWALAGMRYWTKIQHKDGSFDEFYPNERGWTGPTGFLLYAMCKSFMLLNERNEFPNSFCDEFFTTCRRSADYIIKWDESGVLANHHAMAILPITYAHNILKQDDLLEGYEKKLKDFLSYHTDEGWSLEYDGADIGYLSATVSFLAKAYKINKDERLMKVMKESTEFLSYFVYPNGFYAGSIGSRQTLHFYSHGCELLSNSMPLAGRIADEMLKSLHDDKIVPAEIQSDRYFLYRIPEHLESYIDYGKRNGEEKLPYEREDFEKTFPKGGFAIRKKGDVYLLANLAKGGVVKLFSINNKKLLLNDCGIIGETINGLIITSNWIGHDYNHNTSKNEWTVEGTLHTVPMSKVFTPVKRIVFIMFMLMVGWNTWLAYHVKGLIRKILVFTKSSEPIYFKRKILLEEKHLLVENTIRIKSSQKFKSLQIGDEFFVRYVPQSLYFQSQEFDSKRYELSKEELERLNETKVITITKTVEI